MRVYRGKFWVNLALRWAPKKMPYWLYTPPGLHVPPIALKLWGERPDLRAKFNLARIAGRQGLSRWFAFHAFGEFGLIADEGMRKLMAPWHQPYPGLAQWGAMPITWLMRAVGRREGFAADQLHSAEGQQRLISWYARIGLVKYGWMSLLPDDQAALMAEAGEGEAGDGGAYPRIFDWIWEDEPDVRARFAGGHDPLLRAWLYENGGARWPVLADPRLGLARTAQQLPWMGYFRYVSPDKRSVNQTREAAAALPFGVNLIGHARARLGVGEDVRMAVRALEAAKIPFAVRDLAVGANVELEDTGQQLCDVMPYRFTMFCTTGMETVRAIGLMGRHMLEGRTVIGFWPWELPEFPLLWHHAYAYVDQVWASSRYSHDAYVRSAPVPVQHMPMAVCVEETEGKARADFGLPEGVFLFVFTYDALSVDARKNPQACLAAFDRAFPKGDEKVGLVIKGHRVSDSPAWQALKERAAHDPRLFLMGESLGRGVLLDLYRACDCFVSLHRAEGFGRNIAECMALGRPVIVTAHSGNMDFTRWDSAALVPARLREVLPGEYPYAAGQIWAEPNVDAAAELMLRMTEDAAWREGLAQTGQARILHDYAPAQVGQAWAAALHQMDEVGAVIP